MGVVWLGGQYAGGGSSFVRRAGDMGVLSANGDTIYQYMNFDQIEDFKEVASTVSRCKRTVVLRRGVLL
ncbi:hypothetical protein J8I87_28735 [Paraburkholderia sp. LEh10]|uniref:hypothetical protein n=1 Tax=Paraburkholderia sp. LEh10 TaxID=2821353 RepID=UPI001AEAB86A|nr:hypothetical protein [Paraburkholderia sp. LEh10]MBP0593607.1 hypothetical protein [Paraburkholderia sp. LEh10]